MKKNLCISAIISAALSALGLIVNLIGAYSYGVAPLTLSFPGGDCVEYIGFGIDMVKVFAESTEAKAVSSSIVVEFHWLSLFIAFIIIFIIVFAITTIISKVKAKNKK